MKLTADDKELFENLGKSALADRLIGFLKRMTDDLCDIRTIGELSPEKLQGRLVASQIVERELTERLRSIGKRTTGAPSDFE